MFTPRPLAHLQKNQLFVPTKSVTYKGVLGSFPSHLDWDSLGNPCNILKKKFKRRPIHGCSACKRHPTGDCVMKTKCPRLKPSADDRHDLHVRGLNSVTERDGSDSTEGRDESKRERKKRFSVEELYPVLFSNRGQGAGRVVFPPVLKCSKYSIIGEPKSRKKRAKEYDWVLPTTPPSSVRTLAEVAGSKSNLIDTRTIYGKQSKIQKVPAEISRVNTIILPPLELAMQHGNIKTDANCLAEKRYVVRNRNDSHNAIRSASPPQHGAAFQCTFHSKRHVDHFVKSLFAEDDCWQNSHYRTTCSHQTNDNQQYCDVLGRQFCHVCSEVAERVLSHVHEESATCVTNGDLQEEDMHEPSFDGVRRIVITKTFK